MPNPTYLPVPLDHLNNQHPTYPKINMFSSSNNGNIDPLVSLPFFNDTPTTTNTNCSKPDQDQDHLLTPFSLFNFPSPFSNYNEDDTAAFLHPLMDYSNPVDADATTISVADPSKKSCPNERHGKTIKQITRKRSSKKDRHSKINTAQGPRDRRMRLSLEVARKFFDLQDMLGFDKASKTVEWLLTESKSAIKELSRSCKLARARSSPSNTSECDVASGIFDESMDVGNNSSGIIHGGGGGGGQLLDLAAKKERKTSSKTQKSRGTISPYLARESRKQARARAKERTMEKMWIRTLNTGSKPSANEEIGNCHWDKPLEIVEESRRCGIIQQLGQHYRCTKPAMGDVAEFEEAKRSGIIEQHMVDDTFANSGDYLQSSGISQQRQFRDSQLFSKPWDGYNYLC